MGVINDQNMIEKPKVLRKQLKQLRADVDGVMVDVSWGIVERQRTKGVRKKG